MTNKASLDDTDQLDLRELLACLLAFKKGDLSVRMPLDRTGLAGKIADGLNDVIDQSAQLAREIDRVSVAVGKEGKTGQRAQVAGVSGQWAASLESVNALITDVVQPTTEISRVIGAVAKGDLTQVIQPKGCEARIANGTPLCHSSL